MRKTKSQKFNGKKHKSLFLLMITILIGFLVYKYEPLDLINGVINSNTIGNKPILDIASHATEPSLSKIIEYPSDVLNLSDWKVTLPTGYIEKPNEIKQPELEKYKINPWFTLSSTSDAVIFRAPVNGVSTSGSDYPRSELREMSNDGRTNASWPSNVGSHTMFLEQAITAVPNTKRDVVAGQIHDEDKDIIVIRLDYPILHIRVDGENVHTLDLNYTLGKKFSIKFEIKDNKTLVYYNGSTLPVFTLDKKYSDAYFKAGVYTQSNCEREKAKSLCNTDNYGEVFLYKLEVTHK